MRVISDTGENLGVMRLGEALGLAEEKNLDLIEIGPTVTPPIVKMMSYDKFRYQQDKEAKKKQAHNPGDELKQIRISVRAAENDMKIRAKKIDEFLEEGHKVEIMMVLRGREKYNQPWARERFGDFLKFITIPYKTTSPLKSGGKGMITQKTKS